MGRVPRPRVSPVFLSRAAAASLLAVFVGFICFTSFTSLQSRNTVDRVATNQVTAAAYQSAAFNLARANAVYLQMTTAPTPQLLVEWDQAFSGLQSSVDTLAAGNADDRAFATRLRSDYYPLFDLLRPQFASVVTENPADPLAFIVAGMAVAVANDPHVAATVTVLLQSSGTLLAPLIDTVEVDANREGAASRSELAVYASTQERNVVVGAIIGVISLALASMFWVAARRFLRRDAALQNEMRHLRDAAHTDSLTSLRNRRAFEEDTQLGLDRARSAHAPLSLAMIDVDEFKTVNDTWGHDRGDRVLQSVAGILSGASESGEPAVYRVGGDEFAAIFSQLNVDEAEHWLDCARVTAESQLGGITLSSGVSTFERDGEDSDLLRQEADAALYDAKMRGRNVVVRYRRKDDEIPLFPAAKVQGLRSLLVEGRVTAVFQPIWMLHTNGVFAYEALSRPNPSYGLDGPQQAFEIAERLGRAPELDAICLERILAAAGSLPAQALLFVNLSPSTLAHHSFSADVLVDRVAAAGLQPSQVVFEVTERSQVAPAVVGAAVDELRTRGFAVALDDVGTGNNGLEMLRRIEFDYVKVDRSVMLAALAADGKGRAALMAILAFAAYMKAVVIAEGIEDTALLSLVQEIALVSLQPQNGLIQGIQGQAFDAVQGYLLGRPEPTFLSGDAANIFPNGSEAVQTDAA
jgi:diguanylate cyclase (GGDEF)-like protein